MKNVDTKRKSHAAQAPDLPASTDADWEEWGRRDPYFGVITDPRFRKGAMTDEAKREFLASGEKHVAYVMAMIRKHIDAGFAPRSVLDFGCGVGRILLPFAQIAPEVVGLDVSPSMLREAQRNLDTAGATNVRLLASDDELLCLGHAATFDLVHSFIVFQHIPPDRGRAIFTKLLARVAPGGVGAIHFSYFTDTATIAAAKNAAWAAAQAAAAAAALEAPVPKPTAVRPGPAAPPPEPDPEMQMNPYPLNELLFATQRSGVHRLHAEFSDHGGELGIFLFFQRTGA